MTLFSSLGHRPFAFLWTGQTVSRLGDSIYRIALAWWVLEKTGSAAAMGTVLIFSSVPMIMLFLVGGIAVDRFARSRVMLASDLLRGAVVTIVAVLAYADRLELWHIFLASLVFGSIGAFFYPAYTALVPEVTPQQVLPSANSLTSLSGQVTGVLGPAIGGTLVGWGGTPTAFMLDGVSFLISAICLMPLLGYLSPRPAEDQSTGVLRELREGFGIVLGSPWLWISIALFGFLNVTASGPFTVALPFLVKDNLHSGVETLGLFYSVASLGAVSCAVFLGRLAAIRRRGLTLYLGTIAWGLTIFVLGLPLPIAVLLLAAFAEGASVEAGTLVWTNTLQELVPRRVLGRVSSIDYLGSFLFLPIGYGVTGYATDLLGAPLVFLLGGALTSAFGALALLHPAVRHLD